MIGEHRDSCEYELLTCRFDGASFCQEKIKRKEIDCHEAEACKYRLVECELCGKQQRSLNLMSHKQMECTKRPTNCPNNGCEEVIPLESKHDHLQICPFEKLDCPLRALGVIGCCDGKVARKDLGEHATSKDNYLLLLHGLSYWVNQSASQQKRIAELEEIAFPSAGLTVPSYSLLTKWARKFGRNNLKVLKKQLEKQKNSKEELCSVHHLGFECDRSWSAHKEDNEMEPFLEQGKKFTMKTPESQHIKLNGCNVSAWIDLSSSGPKHEWIALYVYLENFVGKCEMTFTMFCFGDDVPTVWTDSFDFFQESGWGFEQFLKTSHFFRDGYISDDNNVAILVSIFFNK